ncbi:helix-turn-helix transcriptional regulator, partial [Nostoc sp. NIES-2111]
MADDCPLVARTHSLASFAELLSDPIRATIILALTDGSERAAGDLARLAGASPRAATLHLNKLINGGLLSVVRRGRFRLYRIDSGEMAEMLEALSNLVEHPPGRANPELRAARMCYDHVAGRLGCEIYDALVRCEYLCTGTDGPMLSPAGTAWCACHGLHVHRRPKSRRPMVLLCRDWTENRPHVGGILGAALGDWFRLKGFIRRRPEERTVEVSPAGWHFLMTE